MSSFAKCFREAGPFLPPQAKRALSDAARAQRQGGASALDAGRAATQALLDQTQAKLAAAETPPAAKPLAQPKKGTFSPSEKTITLLANADLSTFTHELGHFFLDTMADVAAHPGAPADVVADMNALLTWFGVADLATWR
ncbi:MAG: hypothetical protein ACRC1H_07530, partial [Caldilineaceae bacterium]